MCSMNALMSAGGHSWWGSLATVRGVSGTLLSIDAKPSDGSIHGSKESIACAGTNADIACGLETVISPAIEATRTPPDVWDEVVAASYFAGSWNARAVRGRNASGADLLG